VADGSNEGGGRYAGKQEDGPRVRVDRILVLDINLDHNKRMPRDCKGENEIASDKQTRWETMTVDNEDLAEMKDDVDVESGSCS